MNVNHDAPEHDLFRSLSQELTNLHARWSVYRQLFAANPQRVELLNATGPLVFFYLQHLLMDEVTLAISRMTDPACTGNKENHSLQRLVEEVEESNLKAKLESILEALLTEAKEFRDRRNQAIAHSDLGVMLNRSVSPIVGHSREKVEAVLGQLRCLLNSYDQHFFDNTTFYDDVILPSGSDGEFLTEQLKRAVAFRDLEKEGKLDRELWIKGRYADA